MTALARRRFDRDSLLELVPPEPSMFVDPREPDPIDPEEPFPDDLADRDDPDPDGTSTRTTARHESAADRPRERLLRRRAHSTRQIARAILTEIGGIGNVARASPRELAKVLGVGVARGARIAAGFELGRRASEVAAHRDIVGRPEDVYALLAPRLAGLSQEVFLVVGLDVRNQLLDIVEVGRGSVNGVEVHPREVFRPLVRMAAAGGVLVHNHPSGDPSPSNEDRELTRRLHAVGQLVGIPIIDHVVIGAHSHRSLAEELGIGFREVPP
jgi:DNA repair protein RadC